MSPNTRTKCSRLLQSVVYLEEISKWVMLTENLKVDAMLLAAIIPIYLAVVCFIKPMGWSLSFQTVQN